MDSGNLSPILQGSNFLTQEIPNFQSGISVKINSATENKIGAKDNSSHFPALAKTIIKPRALKIGDTLGIFTPSWPANILIRDKYLHALQILKEVGFNYIEGSVTRKAIVRHRLKREQPSLWS